MRMVAWLLSTQGSERRSPQYRKPVYFQQQAGCKFGALATLLESIGIMMGTRYHLPERPDILGFSRIWAWINPVWDKVKLLKPAAIPYSPKLAQWFHTRTGGSGGVFLKRWLIMVMVLDIIANSGEKCWCRNIGVEGEPMLDPARAIG